MYRWHSLRVPEVTSAPCAAVSASHGHLLGILLLYGCRGKLIFHSDGDIDKLFNIFMTAAISQTPAPHYSPGAFSVNYGFERPVSEA